MECIDDVDIDALLAERAEQIEEYYPSVITIDAPLLSSSVQVYPVDEATPHKSTELQSTTNYDLTDATPCFGKSALFFEPKGESIPERITRATRALAICRSCDVRERCLEKAIQRKEPWGIWGGEEFLNGKINTGRTNKGRKIPGFPTL